MNYSAELTGKRCGCPTCGEVFSTESNFERHRLGTYQEGRKCAEPANVGLVAHQTNTGRVWKMPGAEMELFK